MDNGASSYRRFLEGDDTGLKELIEDYRMPLQMFILSFVKDEDTAEEAAVETFVKLATKKPRYSGKASFKTWLFCIGRNTAADCIRKQKRHNTVSIDEIGTQASDKPSPEELYITDERNRRLASSMKKLKEAYYTVLWLRYFENLPVRDIAQILHKSEGNTKVLLSRAREALKVQLGKDGFDDENEQ
ncbi:MAG: RNA polymerase sigma factor [Clostridia bacterium]|nr:RNA polymerase sigma factor [Clostridia bacterium]